MGLDTYTSEETDNRVADTIVRLAQIQERVARNLCSAIRHDLNSIKQEAKEHPYRTAAMIGAMLLTRGEKGLPSGRKLAAETKIGYRYVGAAEKAAIEKNGMKIPKVDKAGNPKHVYYTNERFSGGAEAKNALNLPSKPEFRVEFNLQQAPAGYGGLTSHGHVEFTLREGAAPIKANRIEPLQPNDHDWMGTPDLASDPFGNMQFKQR